MNESLRKLPLGAVGFFAAAALQFLFMIVSLIMGGGFNVLTLFFILCYAAVGVFAFMRNNMLLAAGTGALTLLSFAQLILSGRSVLAVFINLFVFIAAVALLFIVLTRVIPNFDPIPNYMGYAKFAPAGVYALSVVISLLSIFVSIVRVLRWHYGIGRLVFSFFATLLLGVVVAAAYFFLASQLITAENGEAPAAPLFAKKPAAPVNNAQPAAPVNNAQPAAPVYNAQPAAARPAGAPLSPAQNPYLRSNAAAAQPAAPAQPVYTAQPVTPAQPVYTAQPVTPVQPVYTAQPVTPVQPVYNAQPAAPVEPTAPVEPAAPVEPTAPVEPAVPVQTESETLRSFRSIKTCWTAA